MDYRKTALQLFDELSAIYADDIHKHIDLCRCYPALADEWEQGIIAYLDNIKKSEDYDEESAKKCLKKIYEKYIKL